MTTMQTVLTQEIINRMNHLTETREASAAFASERAARNQLVHDLIDELTDGEE